MAIRHRDGSTFSTGHALNLLLPIPLMKNIQAFLAGKAGAKKPAKKGEFSGWLPFHTLALKGNALQFVEVRVLGLRGAKEYECIEIPAAPGSFAVECRGARYGADVRVAGMRAYPVGAAVVRGKHLKDLPVDLGGIAVVDIAAVHGSMQEDSDAHEEWLEDILYGDSDAAAQIARWKPTKTEIPFVDGGFGDGSYATYELRQGKQVVGLEVEFIAEGAEYPF